MTSGGMGLTGGIADVGGLYDCFVGIHAGKADDSILDKYDEMRRERYHTVTDPISAQNFRRLWDQDPNTASEKDPFFAVTRQAEADMEFAKKLQNVSHKSRSLQRSKVLIVAEYHGYRAQLYAVLCSSGGLATSTS
jgi:hypothetical protein